MYKVLVTYKVGPELCVKTVCGVVKTFDNAQAYAKNWERNGYLIVSVIILGVENV